MLQQKNRSATLHRQLVPRLIAFVALTVTAVCGRLLLAEQSVAHSPTDQEPATEQQSLNVLGEDHGIDKIYGTLQLRQEGIITAAFSPNGQLVANDGSQLRFWDAEAGTLLESVPTQLFFGIVKIAFDADGTRVACCDIFGGVFVWDCQKKETVFSTLVEDLNGRWHGVALSPDGSRLVASGGSHVAMVWDLESSEKIATLELGEFNGTDSHVAFSPEGATFAVGGNHGVHIIDAESLKEVHAIYAHSEEQLGGIAYLSEDRVLSCGTDKIDTEDGGVWITELKVWNVETGRRVRSYPKARETYGCRAMCITADRTKAIVRSDRAFRVYDLATGEVLHEIIGQRDKGMLFQPGVTAAPDGKTFVFAGDGMLIRRFDMTTGQQIKPIDAGHNDQIANIVPSPEGTRLASLGTDAKVIVWDVASQTSLMEFDYGIKGAVRDAAWSANGRILYTVGASYFYDRSPITTVAAYDTQAQQRIFNRELSSIHYGRCALSPDGKRLAISGSLPTETNRESQFIEIINIRTGRSEISIDRADMPPVLDCQFSADGQKLNTLSEDGLRVWDLSSKSIARRFELKLPLSHAASFSKVSQRAVIRLDDEIRVLNMDEMEFVCQLTMDEVEPNVVAISDDGKLVAAECHPREYVDLDERDAKRQIRIWDVQSKEVVHIIRNDRLTLKGLKFSPQADKLFASTLMGIVAAWDLGDLPK